MAIRIRLPNSVSITAIIALTAVFLVPTGCEDHPSAKSGSSPATDSPEDIFRRVSPAVVRVVVRDRDFKEIGLGSGFFVKANGLLVTNSHVVEGAAFATIHRSDGSTLFVDGILATDKEQDLAVLQVNGTSLPHVSIAPAGSVPAVGARVYAIGNPKGLTNTFSEGLVSSLRKKDGKVWALQTTAAISHGSSGGPLVDTQGRVVGVTTVSIEGGQNLNFAVPALAVRRVIDLASNVKPKPLASAGGRVLGRRDTEALLKAWAAMNEERWSDAVEIITQLKKRDPENPFVWVTLGYVHQELGSHELAVEAMKTAIRLKPDFAAAHNALAEFYLEMGRYDEAVEALKTAIRLNPDDANAHYNLGASYVRMERYAEAVEAVKTAIRLDPDDAMAYCGLGGVYIRMDRHLEGVEAFKTAIRLKPDFAMAYMKLGGAYCLMDRHADAVETLKTAIRLKPDLVEAYYILGRANSDLGRYAEAVKALETATRLKPDFAGAYAMLVGLYIVLDRRGDMVEAYETLNRLDPTRAASLLEKLEVNAEKLSPKKVATPETSEQVTSPEAPEVLKNARKAINDGRINDASRMLGSLKRQYPEDPFVWNALGYMFYRLENYAKAVEAYKTAIRLKSDYAGAHFMLGTTYGNMGRQAEAVRHLQKAVDLKPGLAMAYWELAKAYHTLGKHKEALRAYESLKRLDPDMAAMLRPLVVGN